MILVTRNKKLDLIQTSKFAGSYLLEKAMPTIEKIDDYFVNH